MKQLLFLLALTGILMQNFSRTFVILEYRINQEYIAKYLCENKNKPEMHCNGHCHLKKQLEKNEKREQAPSNNIKEKFEVLFYEKTDGNSLSISENAVQFFAFYKDRKTVSVPVSVFHPPSC